MDCRGARENLILYVDGELPLSESDAIRGHIETCSACAGLVQREEGFRAALGCLEFEPAPPGLDTRIRAALDAEDRRSDRTMWSWFDVILSRRVLGSACAALLIAVIGLALLHWKPEPTESGFTTGVPPAAGVADLVHVKGVVVCVDCDARGGTIEEQRRCRTYGHTAGLRTDSGEVYQFLKTGEESGMMRDLLFSPDRRGSRIAIDGRLYRDIGYIKVAQVSSL